MLNTEKERRSHTRFCKPYMSLRDGYLTPKQKRAPRKVISQKSTVKKLKSEENREGKVSKKGKTRKRRKYERDDALVLLELVENCGESQESDTEEISQSMEECLEANNIEQKSEYHGKILDLTGEETVFIETYKQRTEDIPQERKEWDENIEEFDVLFNGDSGASFNYSSSDSDEENEMSGENSDVQVSVATSAQNLTYDAHNFSNDVQNRNMSGLLTIHPLQTQPYEQLQQSQRQKERRTKKKPGRPRKNKTVQNRMVQENKEKSEKNGKKKEKA